MDFLITISDSYSEPILLLMYSVYRNMGAGHRFHFIHKSISNQNRDIISKYAETKCKAVVRFIEYSDARTKKLPLYGVWSEEVYYRLFAAYLLPDVDRVVYLDGDTLVTRDLKDVWESFPSDCCSLGAVANDVQEEHKTRLGLSPQTTYINSGVLLMSLSRIRRLYSEQELWDTLLQLSSKLQFPDQDFLNIVFQKEIYLLDIRYNYMISVTERSSAYPRIRDPYICHFVLAKPWNEEFLYKTDRIYLRYLAEAGQVKKATYLYYQHRKRRWITKLKAVTRMR